MTKKRASTEAYQAFLPRNIRKFRRFWTQPPPIGINGIRRSLLIDVDEFDIDLTKTARKFGHSHCSLRIRKAGHFTRDTRIHVVIAIEPGDPNLPLNARGSVGRPRKWIRFYDVGTFDEARFVAFVDYVCADLEMHPVSQDDRTRVFIWDNLSAHKTDLVYQTVEGRPAPSLFRIVCRPPYQPKVAPVEYKICDICQYCVRQITEQDDHNALQNMILRCFATVGDGGNFDRTFEHCGYTVTGQGYPVNGYDP